MRRILAAIMRSIFGVVALPFHFAGRVFSAFGSGGGGTSPEEMTQKMAARAAADEVVQNKMGRPQREIDRPSEIKRVAGRLALGRKPDANAKLSSNVIGALMLMSRADLKTLANAHPEMVAEFAASISQMKIEPALPKTIEPATPSASVAISAKIAARKSAQANPFTQVNLQEMSR